MAFEKYLDRSDENSINIPTAVLTNIFMHYIGIPGFIGDAFKASEELKFQVNNKLGNVDIDNNPIEGREQWIFTSQEGNDLATLLLWIMAAPDTTGKLVRKEQCWAVIMGTERSFTYNSAEKIRAGIANITGNTVIWEEEV